MDSLNEKELRELVQQVKAEILADLYGEIGKALFARIVQVSIIGAIALLAWLTGKDLI